MNKIDPKLLSEVNTLNEHDCNCLVYTNNYAKTLWYLKNAKADYKSYPFINAFAIKVKQDKIFQLSNQNHIDYITVQSKVNTQIYHAQKILHIDSLKNEGYSGENVNIAVIDTGIKPHLDFVIGNKIIKFVDFVNGKRYPYDDNGHGTFVSGVLASSGISSAKKYEGVAPSSKLICIKALDENGETGTFKILDAMQWVYDNHKKYNIKVVCMSFGSIPTEIKDPLSKGAEKLWDSGIIVVAAAGNSGPNENTIYSPGINAKIITVGAVNDNRKENEFSKVDFSSRGPAFNFYKPDCLASGVDIVSTNYGKEFYTKMSGTSVATPIVAGLCAILKQKYPTATPSQIKYHILKHCKTVFFDKNYEGYGVIDAKNL